MINPIAVPKGELGKGTMAKVAIYPTLDQLYDAFEDHLANLVTSRAREGRSAVVVFPVGPIQLGGYRLGEMEVESRNVRYDE